MKNAIQSGLIAALFGVLGVAASLLFVGETKTESVAPPSVRVDAKLRATLSELQSAVSALQDDVKSLKSGGLEVAPRPAATALPKTSALPNPDFDPSSLESMAGKIRELEARLAQSLRSTSELSSEELQAKFAKAMEKEDGKGAMEALVALSKLSDFGAFTRCYGELRGAQWLGLRGNERRGWGSRALYHWILTSSTLGVDGEAAKELQKSALESLRRSDDDKSKVASTLAFFITNQPIPEEIKESSPQDSEKDARRNRRNRRRGQKEGKSAPKDLFRLALFQLGRLKDSAAIAPLGQVMNNAKNPIDTRIMAMRGLIRQEDPAGTRAVEGVLNDPNETLRRQAELALAIKAPAVSGYLVTNVAKESAAASAGLSSGQIITAINGTAVKSNKDLQRALKKVENGKTLAVTVYRNGSSSTVQLKKQGKRAGISGRTVAVKAEE